MTVDWPALRDWGFSVFPLKPRDKKPLGPWKRFQSEPPRQAEIDVWAKRPELNAGIATGAISGVIVLDIDSPEALARVKKLGLPRTPRVRTARGLHVYLQHPGCKIANQVRVGGIALDVRGDGGYVVAPGSVHPNGTVYRWEESPADCRFAAAPIWLLEGLQPKQSAAQRRDARSSHSEMSAYASKTLEEEAARVRDASEGKRNETLNRAAFSLGQLVGADELPRGLVENRLLEAAMAAGLNRVEAFATIKSGLESGLRQPRPPRAEAKTRMNPGTPRRRSQSNVNAEKENGSDGAAADLNDQLADEDLNDLGNARRLLARFGRDLIFVPQRGYFVWDGKRWNEAAGEHRAAMMAHRTAESIKGEIEAIKQRHLSADDDHGHAARERLKAMRGWARASGNAARTNGMLEQARPYLTRQQSALDTHPFLFNVVNGTLDLKGDTICLKPHDRADWLTSVAEIVYDPTAACPKFTAFLKQILPDDEVRDFVQRWFGYCLTGDTSEQKILLMHGTGGNGKSTLLETIASILGPYADSLPFASLLHNDHARGSEPSPDLARLPGKRLVRAAEANEGSRFNESLLKSISGGEPLVARKLRQDFFEFMVQFKLTLSFNVVPTITGGDHGIWRRLCLVPFGVTVPTEQQTPDLFAQFLEERSGILNWLIAGYAHWREIGLKPPSIVRAATADYRQTMDTFGAFIDACVVRSSGERVQAGDLLTAYNRWAEANGHRSINQRSFGMKMQQRGFHRIKSSTFFYLDITLRERATNG